MKAPYQNLFLDQLSDSELEEIRNKVNQNNPELLKMLEDKDENVIRGAERALK